MRISNFILDKVISSEIFFFKPFFFNDYYLYRFYFTMEIINILKQYFFFIL